MARSPNDDRSDSKNPNNSAYWASQDNHARQTGGTDDDDEDDWPALRGGTVAAYVAPPPERATRPPLEVCVVSPVPTKVKNLRLTYLARRHGHERNVYVDSPSIDEALLEAEAWWETEELSYLALYDGERLYLEHTEGSDFDSSWAGEIGALGDLYGLVRIADECLGNARRNVEACLGKERSHAVMVTLKDFGSCKAAAEELRSELQLKLAALATRGLALLEEQLPEAAAQAKRMLLAAQCSARIRHPTKGTSDQDVYMALSGAQTIASLRKR